VNATQNQIDASLEGRSSAIGALVMVSPTPNVNRTALTNEIERAEGFVQTNYTEPSWTRMQTALRSARNIRVNVTATQEQVDAAMDNLISSINSLVEVESDPGNGMEGSGTEADPYIIMNADDLDNVRNNLSAHYRVGADIDLSGLDWMPIGGTQQVSFGIFLDAFTGSFDGDNHVIINMRVTDVETGNIGLFGAISDALIKNVRLEDVYINAGERSGGIAARAQSSIIENCHTSGAIQTHGSRSFGIAGGIIGAASSTIVRDSSNSAFIYAGQFGDAGGIVGIGEAYIEIENSSNSGSVKGLIAGGIIGSGDVSVTRCFNTGLIQRSDLVTEFDLGTGGIVGYLRSGSVTESFNIGSVRGV